MMKTIASKSSKYVLVNKIWYFSTRAGAQAVNSQKNGKKLFFFVS